MLHAFNQKNARRIFQARASEHKPEKSEDAATSMVFTPLAFMRAEDALECLIAVLGAPGREAVAGRHPIEHEVIFWPQGQAPSWNGDGPTRCEPDLVIHFTFEDGSNLLFVGEMKWNWAMEASALAQEVKRERIAMQALYPNVPQMGFVIAKCAYNRIAGVTTLTWKDFDSRLAPLSRRAVRSPSGIWATLVRRFLAAADEWGFSGIPMAAAQASWDARPAFFRTASPSPGWPALSIEPAWNIRPAFWTVE